MVKLVFKLVVAILSSLIAVLSLLEFLKKTKVWSALVRIYLCEVHAKFHRKFCSNIRERLSVVFQADAVLSCHNPGG